MAYLFELVKIRVVDTLVNWDIAPWIIDEVVDAIEMAFVEGAIKE